MEEILSEAWRELVIAGIGAAVMAVLKPVRIKVVGFCSWLGAVAQGIPRYLSLRSYVIKNSPLLYYRRARRIDRTEMPPAISVINFKGGVGKTTLSANLSAAFANAGLRVLLVDLDYQGSLTAQLRPVGSVGNSNISAGWLSARRFTAQRLQKEPVELNLLPGVRLVTANYELTSVEENQLLRWLLRFNSDDVRARLARWLGDPKVKAKKSYDLIIFDAPPRLSLAAANGLMASQLVVVPFKPDRLSVEPIPPLLGVLREFKDKTGAKFEIGGLIANMTQRQREFTAKELLVLNLLRDETAKIYNQIVPNSPNIGLPEAALAYLSEPSDGIQPRPIFDALAIEIGSQLGLSLSSGVDGRTPSP